MIYMANGWFTIERKTVMNFDRHKEWAKLIPDPVIRRLVIDRLALIEFEYKIEKERENEI